MEFSAHILVLIQMSQDVLEHLSGVLRMSVVLKYVLNMKSHASGTCQASLPPAAPPLQAKAMVAQSVSCQRNGEECHHLEH